ncbi:MAG: DNA/RNA non-specific endonuclease [Bacteroides sp.]|nr:DNA/RNA non-specific endonuclease [Bacteroides sp.]MCM1414259.1 DNA/RNA non-specific endonuclease [Bacteroides sp.]MCM1472403.1 DNA/RNA non-specific endonuclease [Bacteroides sp.]
MARKKKSSGISLGAILAIGALALVVFGAWKYCRNSATDPVEQDLTADLKYVKTDSSLTEQIIHYTGMDVSFNKDKHIPNWVAWELTRDETNGTVKRGNTFYCDDRVEGCPEPYEYSYCGYDRGHMAPAGDMKWSKEAMKDSFYLTNICPQLKSLNVGAWKRLEEKCRTWARADSAIVIVCGPVQTDNIREYIGDDNRIAVPKRFFKVILSPYAKPMRGIGFIMDNGYVKGGMQQAAVPIDEVERVTGHDFFSDLPDDIENQVESQCNFHYWSTIK